MASEPTNHSHGSRRSSSRRFKRRDSTQIVPYRDTDSTIDRVAKFRPPPISRQIQRLASIYHHLTPGGNFHCILRLGPSRFCRPSLQTPRHLLCLLGPGLALPAPNFPPRRSPTTAGVLTEAHTALRNRRVHEICARPLRRSIPQLSRPGGPKSVLYCCGERDRWDRRVGSRDVRYRGREGEIGKGDRKVKA